MDDRSFDDEMINELHISIIDCIYCFHCNSVYKKTNEEMQADLRASSNTRSNNIPGSESIGNEEDDDDDDNQSPFQTLLYKRGAEKKTNRVGTHLPTVFDHHYEIKRKNLKEKVETEVRKYLQYCKNMNILDLLDNYGTNEYSSLKLNNDKILKKIVQTSDPLQAANLFDLLK